MTKLCESIINSLEGKSTDITCYVDDQLGPISAKLISKDDGIIHCSNCGSVLFNVDDSDEMNELSKNEFLFTHGVIGNINEQHRKIWIVSWENWDAYVGFTYPSKSFYNEEDADKFIEALNKNENNREILKYASTGTPSVHPPYTSIKEKKDLGKHDLIKKIRKPLPPQKHSIHKDKTKYDRKRDKKNIDEARKLVYSYDFLRSGKIEDIDVNCKTFGDSMFPSVNSTETYLFFDSNSVARCNRCRMDIDDPDFYIFHDFHDITLQEIIRKVGDEYVLYSKKKDPKTGKRRVLGRSKTKEGIEKREAQVNYFKNKG